MQRNLFSWRTFLPAEADILRHQESLAQCLLHTEVFSQGLRAESFCTEKVVDLQSKHAYHNILPIHMLSYHHFALWRLTFGSSTAQKEAARLHRCAVFVVIGCVISNKLVNSLSLSILIHITVVARAWAPLVATPPPQLVWACQLLHLSCVRPDSDKANPELLHQRIVSWVARSCFPLQHCQQRIASDFHISNSTVVGQCVCVIALHLRVPAKDILAFYCHKCWKPRWSKICGAPVLEPLISVENKHSIRGVRCQGQHRTE